MTCCPVSAEVMPISRTCGSIGDTAEGLITGFYVVEQDDPL
jgi:hypothetical protein